MISLIVKYLWAQRKSNLLLFIELMVAGVFLFMILDWSISSYRLYRVPTGFNVENCYSMGIELNVNDSSTAVLVKDALGKFLKSRPEIENFSVTTGSQPYSGSVSSTSYKIGNVEEQVDLRTVDEAFASVLSIHVLHGRWLNQSDIAMNSKVCVATTSICEKMGIEKNPIGKKVAINIEDGGSMTIVGVIPSIKTSSYAKTADAIYFPVSFGGMVYGWNLVVKVRKGQHEKFVETLSYINEKLSKEVGFTLRDVSNFEQMKTNADRSDSNRMEGLMWITLFFLLNIYLGIYIVFSGRVKKRFQEVGLRMAIGSTRIGVVGLIAGESLMLLLLSSIPVLIAAINFAYFGLLNASFEVSSLRVILEFALTELILSVAVIASVIIPALRASKTNPAEVLHYE